MAHRVLVLVALPTALVGFGCSSGDLVLPNTSAPAQLTVVSGDFQTGTAGGMLSEPLVVRVTDAADRPVGGAGVAFSTSGQGELIPASTTTGADGLASVRWTLDATPGTQQATARVSDAAPADLTVTFTATASIGDRPRLNVITQPSASARTGVEFSRQPRVQVENVDPGKRAGIAVVAALASGSGTLGGTTRRETNSSGVAEFTDLSISGPPGSYTLLFSAVGVEGAASSPIQITAEKSPTSIRILEHTPDPSDVGRPVSVRVAVEADNGGTPSGTFTVTASSGESCSASAGSGTCELTFNSAGTRTLVARYAGNDDFEASESDAVTHVVNAFANATQTTIGTAPDPSEEGDEVTVFITVRASGGERPRGTVRIYDQSPRCGDGELLGQVELNGDGEARFKTKKLEPGFHIIRGCYLGTSEFAPSDDIANHTVLPD
jgi:hypothetical protein